MPSEPLVFVINTVWIVFFLFIAASAMKYKVAQVRTGKLRISTLGAIPFALFFFGIVLFESGMLDAWLIDNFYYGGVSVTIAGFLIYGIARFYIADSWSLAGQIFATRVVSEGIYSYIRHPMYLGITLMMAGSALMASNLILLALIPAIALSFFALARNEEQTLELIFKDYAAYKSRTNMFLPGLL